MCEGEDYSEFLICMDLERGIPAEKQVSVCEQRNAAVVVRVLEERRGREDDSHSYTNFNRAELKGFHRGSAVIQTPALNLHLYRQNGLIVSVTVVLP